MGTRVELPEGNWADLYDPVKVPERKRRPVVRAVVRFFKDQQASAIPAFDPATVDEDTAATIAAQLGPDLLGAADDLNDAVITALVQSWSYGDVTTDVLLELPADAYKLLSEACQPHMTGLMPNFGTSPDPKAITGS